MEPGTKNLNSNSDENFAGISHYDFFERKQSDIPESDECEKSIGKVKIYAWGKDNLYPQWLNQLVQLNAIHSGIIRAKVHFTVSGGLEYEGPDAEAWQKFYDNGKSDYTLDEIAEQASGDFERSNKFILRGVWSMDFSRVDRLELIDFEKGRKVVGKKMLAVSQDWTDQKCNIRYYEQLDVMAKGSDPTSPKKRSREFYIEYQERVKQYKYQDRRGVSRGIYPEPPYSGGLRSICTGIAIDEYQNAEIMNGFSLGTLISLNSGKPKNPDDKKKLEQGLKGTVKGPRNSGGTMIVYSQGKENAPTVLQLSGNDLNSRYIELNKDTQKNILRAHSVTVPVLFGFKEEGSMGNNTELMNGYVIMKSNYFKSRQDAILSVLNYIGQKCNGLQGQIKFREVDLNLPEEKPATNSVVIDQRKFIHDKFEKCDENHDDKLLEALSKCGTKRSAFRVLHAIDLIPGEPVLQTAAIDDFKKAKFIDLSTIEAQVLNLISQGEDFDNIRKALEIKGTDLVKIYSNLMNQELLTDGGELTDAGARQVAHSNIDKMQILYSYELRSDAPALVAGGESRKFCTKLIELDRLYTREDIDAIGAAEGYDVFAYKGGWYHNPKSDVNTPWCRHTWRQNVVFVD